MMRLLIVQYSGDYREAYRRLTTEGDEVYYGHRYVLDTLAQLGRSHGAAGVLCCVATPHIERLPNGVTVMGAGARPGLKPGAVTRMIEEFDPTHLIVHGPMPALIRWGLANRCRTACVFADSFAIPRVIRWLRFGWLRRMLNDPAISLVGNHGINAARGLAALGVDPAKILAWDYPHVHRPEALPAKLRPSAGPFTIAYVGSLDRKKGVGDLLTAVAQLRRRELDVRLLIAGAGRRAIFEAQAARLGIADAVDFLGIIPNPRVLPLMHSADVVVVPSRHAFPEGLPLTLYEGLASRSPVIASDHPMFAGHFRNRETALIFEASNPTALAACIAELRADHALYARLSAAAPVAWMRMQVPTKWGEMINHWMRDGAEDRAWLAAHSLAPPSAPGG